MNSELDLLRDARPPVPVPRDDARQAALRRLLATIEDEPPGLHAHRAARAHPRSSSGTPGQSRRRGRVGRLGPLVPVAVVMVAALVVVSALVLLGHRGSGALTPVTAGGEGTIAAAGGVALAGPHARAGLPAPIVAGLRREYGAQLRAGKTLHTLLDRALERTGERSLRHSIAVNGGTGGAFVALDPSTGAIDAIGTAAAGRTAGLQDRAVSLAGPVGGTFAPITALAALQDGVWSPGEMYDDTGRFCTGSSACFHEAGDAAYGRLSLPGALAVGASTLFADLGDRMNSDAADGGALQRWARRLGLGSPTYVDLPDETAGLVPSPGSPTRAGRDAAWSVDDNISLAVGQGDLRVTPLQLAVAYAAIDNGGTLLVPQVADALGRAGTRVRRTLHLSTADLAAVRAGLRGSAAGVTGHVGTTQRVFGSFAPAVSGEPGTTQLITGGREVTDGWYAGYVAPTAHGRPLVVVVLVQGGGFGAVSAAPVARQIFSQWTTGHAGRYVPGDSQAR